MSDDGLRALERRWRATRDVSDEARWLLGRVQAGELALDMLTLAARFGHPASALVVEVPHEDDLWAWAEGLVLTTPSRLDPPVKSTVRHVLEHSATWWSSVELAREVCVRAALAAAESVPHLAQGHAPSHALGAARAWLSRPSVAACAEADAAEESALRVHEALHEAGERHGAAAVLACALAAGAAAVGGSDLKAAARAAAAAAEASSAAAVRQVVAASLVAWALAPRS